MALKRSDSSANLVLESDDHQDVEEVVVNVLQEPFYLIWNALSVKERSAKGGTDIILNSVNGGIKSGTMTGLLGPSGAGKTTLLYAISNRLDFGVVEGDITLHTPDHPVDFRIGFVPQEDMFYDMLTVEEAVLFASRLQNKKMTRNEHRDRGDQVLRQLDLLQVSKNAITALSGGQRKRVSIATELVSNPKILFLDEPTSSLDSSMAFEVVTLLRNLCESSGPAILLSVHQPSKDILLMFHFVYLLSKGDKIYQGSPDHVVTFLESFGYESKSDNPAEFMLEVASNPVIIKHKYNNMLTTAKNLEYESGTDNMITTPMSQVHQRRCRNFFIQAMIIINRILQIQVTHKPYHTACQMVLGCFVGLLISYLVKDPIGPRPLCVEANSTSKSSNAQAKQITEAFSLFSILIVHCSFIYGMQACMTFGRDLNIISKEVANYWYSIYAYFTAKILIDLILLMVSFLPMFLIIYFCTQQPHEFERGFKFFIISCASAFIWQGWSQLFTIITNKNMYLTVTLACTLFIPMYLLSGIFVKVDNMSVIPKTLSWLSDVRFITEAMIIAIYKGRCDHIQPPLEAWGNFVPTNSAMLNFFSIKEDQEKRDQLIILAHVVFIKLGVLVGLVARIFFKKRL